MAKRRKEHPRPTAATATATATSPSPVSPTLTQPQISIASRIAVSVITALIGFIVLYLHQHKGSIPPSTGPTFLPGGIPSYSTALASFERLGTHQRQVIRLREQAYRRFLKEATTQEQNAFEHVLNFPEHFARSRDAASKNEQVGSQIANVARSVYAEQLEKEEREEDRDRHWLKSAKRRKRSKFSTQPYTEELNHLVRDWSTEGQIDRDIQYSRILSALQRAVPTDAARQPRILVPGAGLGRLAFYLSEHGYEVDMNEIDPASLMVVHWLCSLTDPITYHPFVLEWAHQRSANDRYRGVSVPDKSLNCSSVKLIEGSFYKVFDGVHDQYDAVVTLFFIDIVPNLPQVLSLIKSMLKKDGIWINLGRESAILPLLYFQA